MESFRQGPDSNDKPIQMWLSGFPFSLRIILDRQFRFYQERKLNEENLKQHLLHACVPSMVLDSSL